MSIEDDAEELGRLIRPNPASAYRELPHQGSRYRWLPGRRRAAGTLLGGAAAAAMLTLVVVGAVGSRGPLGAGHPFGTPSSADRHVADSAGLAAGVGRGATGAINGTGSPGGATGSGNLVAPTGPAPSAGAWTATATATASGATGGGQSGTAQASPPFPFPGPRTPPPSPAPTSGTTVTITEQSDGDIRVARGTTVRVVLSGHPPYRWSVPQSSEPRVLTPTSGGTDSNGGATATFVAGASGQSTISADDSPQCSPACGAPSRLWSVTVTVI